MTAFASLRTALQKRIAYHRTCHELRTLPRDLAIEDLGISRADIPAIARKAIYG